MKTVIVCPSSRHGVAFLDHSGPLCNVVMLGKRLVDYWMDHAAALGAREALLLEPDFPDEVRETVGDGRWWNLNASVIHEPGNISDLEIRAKYKRPGESWLEEPNDIHFMDRLPGLKQDRSLFHSWKSWIQSLMSWMPLALSPDRVGQFEIQPRVWRGLHTRIEPDARLEGPCWIGDHVYVGSQSQIGPWAVLEDGVYVDAKCRIARTAIRPDTYVGVMTQLYECVVQGKSIVNWETGAQMDAPEPFLLNSLASF